MPRIEALLFDVTPRLIPVGQALSCQENAALSVLTRSLTSDHVARMVGQVPVLDILAIDHILQLASDFSLRLYQAQQYTRSAPAVQGNTDSFAIRLAAGYLRKSAVSWGAERYLSYSRDACDLAGLHLFMRVEPRQYFWHKQSIASHILACCCQQAQAAAVFRDLQQTYKKYQPHS